jgi:uridine kinase
MVKKSTHSRPFIIAIAGGTGSGKSLFASILAKRFPNKMVPIPQDMYYKDQGDLPMERRVKSNMDTPDAVDIGLLVSHIKALSEGKPIQQPIYDFPTHTRKKETKELGPKPVIVVEGLLTLSTKDLRELFDLTIYIDVDPDLRLARRIQRDVKEKRNKSLEASIEQYLTSARPMHKIYVEPQRNHADLIIPWSDMNMGAVDTVAARIKERIEAGD